MVQKNVIFLGVICARGTFNYNDNQIQIFIPYKKSVLKSKKKDHNHSAYYRFLGSKTNQMTQVGNAVPPFLARAIGEAIYAKLEKK